MIRIDPEFQALIPPPPAPERAALEASIRRDGVRDPLVVWRGLLVDGHTRYAIWLAIGREGAVLPVPRTRELDLPDRAAVKRWIIENQCARRNLTRFQRTTLLAMNGGERPAYASPSEWTLARWGIEHGHAPAVLAGKLTEGMLRCRRTPRKLKRDADVSPPRGPHKAEGQPLGPIPEGHELGGVSTLTDATGATQSQWTKTRVAGSEEPPVPVPEDFLLESVSVMQRGDASTVVQWARYSPEKKAQWEAWKQAMAEAAELYRGVAEPVPGPDVSAEDLITLFPIGDPHIGLLSWAPETGAHFDTKIACRELLACARELIADAPASHECILGNLGDALHAQDNTHKTPGHGHKLDVDGRTSKVRAALFVLFRGITDLALSKFGRVKWRNLPGNHDPEVAAMIAAWLSAVYEREPRVTVEPADRAHQYDRFGANLFGWHHGDRNKDPELPGIMSKDNDGSGTGWMGSTSNHVWHVGHIHHKTIAEMTSCTVEHHNTLAAPDSYHAGKYRSRRMLQAITYHKEWGEHRRSTVSLARVRAALEAQKGAA